MASSPSPQLLPIRAHSPDKTKSWDASPLASAAAAAATKPSSSPSPPLPQPTPVVSAPTTSSEHKQSRAKIDPSKFANGKKFVSFEFFPPRTSEGTVNLMKRIENMGKLKPLFVDLTTSSGKRLESLEICAEALMFCGVNVMLHVLCTRETKQGLVELLDLAKQRGIRNLMVLRGDITGQQVPSTSEEFPRASDMIRFIRQTYGEYFCIACAGYPEGDAIEHEHDLQSLLAKQQAGASFCITQLFFDVDVFTKFEYECRERGITLPILPGIMPIQLFKVFDRTVKYLGTKVPQRIWDAILPIQHDDAAVREYGIQLALEMSQTLLASGAPGVHFFTHNLERSVAQVVGDLNIHPPTPLLHNGLPWKQSVHDKRAHEDVRPIFWSNKPNSYIARTQAWDEFPNGRWGDSSSPAFGDLKGGSHFYASSSAVAVSAEERRLAWGASPLSVAELAEVFVRFINGEIDFLPWSETPGLALETGAISQTLIAMNRHGMLTINSQPKVNALASSNPTFGWGPNNGIVYQKAYVEFFVCDKGARALLEAMRADAAKFGSLSFHACNAKGEELKHNTGGNGPCAVTWGVFPNREILQPTIVDPASFRAWKDEAFELWVASWASAYNEDSPSYGLIWDVHDSFWLVNVVDHDFIHGDIFEIFNLPSVQAAASFGLCLTAE
ncbi:hypothetical protein BASA81_002933 [Batrachochytrium salamandrivorans]|nr:hypothetical protein BASA81_002933 [Batrachochytrium salamandrivorans]